MLIVALALAVVGLAALVTAVVTSNEIVAWVCIAASALGVVLLVMDAYRERQSKRAAALVAGAETTTEVIEQVETGDSGEEVIEDAAATDTVVSDEVADELAAEIAEEDHPEEVVHDEPEFDTYSDDEPEYPEAAEESALHGVDETGADDEGAKPADS